MALLRARALSGIARGARNLVGLAVAASIAAVAIGAYLDSPSRRARVALAEARRIEEAGRPDAALAAWEAAATEWRDRVDGEALRPVAEAVVRLGAATAKEPFAPDAVEHAARLVARFQALPFGAREGIPSQALTARLLAWAGQVGSATPEQLEAGLRLLELAGEVGGAPAVAARSDALRRDLVVRLAADWPLEALAHCVRLGDASVASPIAARLGPSLLAAAREDIERLGLLARSGPAAAHVRAGLDEAARRDADEARAPALAAGDRATLAALARRRPDDQPVAVALASVEAGAGDLAAARSRLAALGAPGWLIPPGQRLLGSLLEALGRTDEAAGVLARHVAARLPAFQRAARAYLEAGQTARNRLASDLRAGRVPGDVMSQLQGASDEVQRKVIDDWVTRSLEDDRQLADLKAAYVRAGEVVPAALSLGRVRLVQANGATGDARKRLLDDAERLFLAIRHEAAGRPEFHLALGQVYHCFGKTDEAEREFRILLDGDEPAGKLAVARVYRELGLYARARTLAEQVHEGAPSPAREHAAVLRALLADGREERERWLSRADAKDAGVRLMLDETRAERLHSEGKFAEADTHFARIAAAYERVSAHDPASTNNAALAHRARHACTGDPAHLATPVRLLESALRVAPDNALLTGNLAETLLEQARVRVLEGVVPTRALHLQGNDLDLVVDLVLEGPDGDRARAALRADPAWRRGLEMWRQQEVLAPQSPESYRRQLEGHLAVRDDAAHAAVAERVGRARLDTALADEAWRKWVDGSDDARVRRVLDEAAAHGARLVAAGDRSGGRTAAAAHALAALTLLRRASAFGAVDDLEQAVAGMRRAVAGWPASGTRPGLAWTLAHLAVARAAAASPAVADLWRTKRREHGIHGLILQLLRPHPRREERIAALRAQPALAEAIALLRAHPTDRPRVSTWLVARLAGDAPLAAASRAAFDRPEVLRDAEATVRLFPARPAAAAFLELLKSKGDGLL